MNASNAFHCPVCGAVFPGGETCEEVFGELMAMEYADPEAFSVHPLTVACYMIQHGLYSDEALAWIVPRLRSLLDGSLDNQGLLEYARKIANPSRSWRVTRQAHQPPLPRRAWRATIAGIPRQPETNEEYTAAVREWTRAVLEQLSRADSAR